MEVSIKALGLPPLKGLQDYLIDPELIADCSYWCMNPVITMKDNTKYIISSPTCIEEASKQSQIIKNIYDDYVRQLTHIDPELIADNIYPQFQPEYKDTPSLF